MLLAAAMIWGAAFMMMKGAVEVLPVCYLLALRFTVGAAVVALIAWRRWREFTWDYLWRGAVIGGCLWLAYAVQTFGLQWTTPSNNAFLTSIYCVLVPFLHWLIVGTRPDRYNVGAAILCVAGIGLVSMNGSFHIAIGDGLTLVSAVFFALHIVMVAKVSPGKDIYLLTVFQFAFAALYSWAGTFLTETIPPVSVFTPDLLLQLGYLAILSTAVALLFQNVGQVWSDPASASVILSLESVFGVLFSVVFYGDPLTARLLCGFGLIFLAVIISETKLSFLKGKVRKA